MRGLCDCAAIPIIFPPHPNPIMAEDKTLHIDHPSNGFSVFRVWVYEEDAGHNRTAGQRAHAAEMKLEGV